VQVNRRGKPADPTAASGPAHPPKATTNTSVTRLRTRAFLFGRHGRIPARATHAARPPGRTASPSRFGEETTVDTIATHPTRSTIPSTTLTASTANCCGSSWLSIRQLDLAARDRALLDHDDADGDDT